MNHLEKYLTYAEIGKQLSRSASCIKRWASEGYLGFPRPSYLGRNAVIRETDVVNWVKKNLSNTSPEATKSPRAA